MQQNIAFHFFILATFLTEKTTATGNWKRPKHLFRNFFFSFEQNFASKKNLLGVEISPILKDKKKIFQNPPF
jgi:hypothetical protein